MILKDGIFYTAYISLVVQLLTGSVGALGVFIDLKEEDRLLRDVLKMETIVQFVELAFYSWLVYNLGSLPDNVTSLRYLDWNITTPIMLIATVLYMRYNQMKDEGKIAKTQEILERDKKILIRIVVFNFLMLLFGLLGELNYLSTYISFPLGFIFFYLSFNEIKVNYVGENLTNINLYYFLFFVWALYGVAALFGHELKNTSYNILDIFSKNFYGLFIFYVIYKTNMNY